MRRTCRQRVATEQKRKEGEVVTERRLASLVSSHTLSHPFATRPSLRCQLPRRQIAEREATVQGLRARAERARCVTCVSVVSPSIRGKSTLDAAFALAASLHIAALPANPFSQLLMIHRPCNPPLSAALDDACRGAAAQLKTRVLSGDHALKLRRQVSAREYPCLSSLQ